MAILYKFSDVTNIMYERAEFKAIAATSRHVITKLRKQFPNEHPKSWVYDVTLGKGWNHPLPKHWKPILSTPYRDFEVTING